MINHFKRAAVLFSCVAVIFVGYKNKYYNIEVSVRGGINGSESTDRAENTSLSSLNHSDNKTSVDVGHFLHRFLRLRKRISPTSISARASTSQSPSPSPEAKATSPSSKQRWRSGYDRVINNSFGSTWSFFGWWRVQSWNGGSRSAVANYTTRMNFYPGVADTTPISAAGKILVTLFNNGDLEFTLRVRNAGQDCTGEQNTNSDGCVVRINEGSSCDTVEKIGRPFYNSSNIEWTNGDPFLTSEYASDSSGLSNSINLNGGNC